MIANVQPAYSADRVFGVAALAISLIATWMIYDDLLDGSWADRGVALRAIGTSIAILVPLATSSPFRGQPIGFLLLWSSWGLAVGLGGMTIFSIGLLYLAAAVFVGVEIAMTPTATPFVSRAGFGYVLAGTIALVAVSLLLSLARP